MAQKGPSPSGGGSSLQGISLWEGAPDTGGLSEPESTAILGLRQRHLDPGGRARPMMGPNPPSEARNGALPRPLQVSAPLTRGLRSPSTHQGALGGEAGSQQRHGCHGEEAVGLCYTLPAPRYFFRSDGTTVSFHGTLYWSNGGN